MPKEKFPNHLREEFSEVMAPRFDELAHAHDSLIEKPADAFAKKIGGPATHEARKEAHDRPPVSHEDREW